MLSYRMKRSSKRLVAGTVAACAAVLLSGHPAHVPAEDDPTYLARPVFLAASGTHDEMLADLLVYDKTVEWQEVYGVVPPVHPHVRHDFYSLERRLLTVLPGADEYWPFVYSWLADHRIDLECSSVEQPPLGDLQPANHGGLFVPYGFAAPFIRYSIDKNRAAYILLTQADNARSSNDLFQWGKMYTIEPADTRFPEEAGWDLSLQAEGVLASWSIPLELGEGELEGEQVLMAAWLVFQGKDIEERLLPALNGIKSFHSRPAVDYRLVEHEDSGAEEGYMSLPKSASGIYRIHFTVYPEDRRQAAELQEVVTDVSAWPAAHVGVFSMGDKGWLLLIFKGVADLRHAREASADHDPGRRSTSISPLRTSTCSLSPGLTCSASRSQITRQDALELVAQVLGRYFGLQELPAVDKEIGSLGINRDKLLTKLGFSSTSGVGG